MKQYGILEKYNLEKMVKDKRRNGETIQSITNNCNQLLPTNEKISKRVIEYYLQRKGKNEIDPGNIDQQDLLEKLNRIENEIWDLIEEAKILKDVAKQRLNEDPAIFDHSLRTLNQILNTALSLIKELKIPTENLHFDNRKESLSILLDFSSGLDPDIKKIIIQNIDKYIEDKKIKKMKYE